MGDVPTKQPHDEEHAAFQKMLPTLLSTYANQFVAICSGKVIDSDPDEFELAERVNRLPSDQFVLIERVSEEGAARVWLE